MGGDDLLTELLFTPDSDHVLIARANGDLEKWQLETAERVLAPMPHRSQIVSVATSPDGNLIVTHSLDQKIRLWSGETGSELRDPIALRMDVPAEREYFSHELQPFSFHPDGSYLAIASGGSEATIWKLDLAQLYPRSLKHRGAAYWVRFSRDGRWLLSGTRNARVRIWEASTGHQVSPPLFYPEAFWGCESSPATNQEFVIPSFRGTYRRYIRTENRPLHDVAREVLLFSGQTVEAGGLVPIPPQRLADAWAYLSTKYPDRSELKPEEEAMELRSEASYYFVREKTRAMQNLDALLATSFARSRDFEMRGDLHANSGNWKNALRDYQEASRRRPDSVRISGRLALLQLQIGDEDGYRHSCRDLVERFVASRNPDRAIQLAHHCVEAQALAGFERAAVAQAESLLESLGGESWEAWEYLALSHYRAEDFENALKAANSLIDLRQYPSDLALTAMAHHALGRRSQARSLLAQAEAASSSTKRSQWHLGELWSRRIREGILLREARSVIN